MASRAECPSDESSVGVYAFQGIIVILRNQSGIFVEIRVSMVEETDRGWNGPVGVIRGGNRTERIDDKGD